MPVKNVQCLQRGGSGEKESLSSSMRPSTKSLQPPKYGSSSRDSNALVVACTLCGHPMDRSVDVHDRKAMGLLRKVQKVLDVVSKRIAHDLNNPLNVVTILHGVCFEPCMYSFDSSI
jgi:hypothetical protein